MERRIQWRARRLFGAAIVLGAAACASGDPVLGPSQEVELVCSIPTGQIFNGQSKDGIPALTDPRLVPVGDASLGYLLDTDRVIGIEAGGVALAIPINVLWWHEIVNLRFAGLDLAITHCPLTGSSLAFDRAPAGGAEFGVSGLLYRNNLIMYDRSSDQSLWPQMARGARCGSRDGVALSMVPLVEMTWQGWRTLHPETMAVSSDTGFDRDYRVYPYGDYDRVDNPELLFPQGGIDGRRPPKERVLGIPDGSGGGVAYPFGELESLGRAAAVSAGSHVVMWDSHRRSAMAFVAELDGAPVEFTVRDGTVVDRATGSVWAVDGHAVEGPLAGRRLEPVAEAYVAYWFAWADFQDGTDVWSAR